ncbi:hypothetical protein ACIRQQ_22410 [Streptomyces fuscichromogenes]|uniref:hypothetical protein n=1 Tax=Streptomyces fuscichromogenes TaxID=1324013 RepID=UPI0037FB4FB3
MAANVALGCLDNYDSGGLRVGGGELAVLGDLLVVAAVNLAVYHWAVPLAVTTEEVRQLVAEDEAGLEANGLAGTAGGPMAHDVAATI